MQVQICLTPQFTLWTFTPQGQPPLLSKLTWDGKYVIVNHPEKTKSQPKSTLERPLRIPVTLIPSFSEVIHTESWKPSLNVQVVSVLSCGFLRLSQFPDQIVSSSEGKENILPCRILKISNFWRPHYFRTDCGYRAAIKANIKICAFHTRGA